jgi:hypothetical protein
VGADLHAPTQSAHDHGPMHVHADGTAHVHPTGVPANDGTPSAPSKDHSCACGCGAACCMVCLPTAIELSSYFLGQGSPLRIALVRLDPGTDPNGQRRPPRPPSMS